jgi:hypothetical protein
LRRASAAAAQGRRDKMLAAIDFMCGSIRDDAADAAQHDVQVMRQLWQCKQKQLVLPAPH